MVEIHLPTVPAMTGENAMNAKNLQRFQKQLNNWLDDLLQQSGRTVSELAHRNTRRPDPMDQAVEEHTRNFSLRISNRQHLLIRKIRQSLQDIEEGTYGICESCGEPIAAARLEARPVARHCIDCKTAMERTERLRA
jgi:DnaK suppressor protein